MYCPICNIRLIGNGIKQKQINHKVLTDRNMKLIYEANRYRCKRCGYSTFEKNPFAIKGFNNSILVMNQVMIDLHDYRLNYTMIGQKNNISANEVIKYFDSFVVVPHIPLPTNLGIDEIHSDMAKRKNASYLCTLTDNDEFKLIDILTSRSKYELALFFESYSEKEREAVKYVTIDMWKPYKEIALKWLPNSVIAVDPFQVTDSPAQPVVCNNPSRNCYCECLKTLGPNTFSFTNYLLKRFFYSSDILSDSSCSFI